MDEIIDELRALIRDLGKDGGLMSPSVYDTAQVIRFAPPEEGVEPALKWLLSQQQPDGGWGNPYIPMSRDVPTLATMLTLKQYADLIPTQSAIKLGKAFLKQQAHQWESPLPLDIPVGVELIFPKLLEDSETNGLIIDPSPYSALIKMGKKRRTIIANMKLLPGTTPTHSWEALGTKAEISLLDGADSLGHSPAATAVWLNLASRYPNLKNYCQSAYTYLRKASQSTNLDIPGVVPTVWPIPDFEQSFGLYALHNAGIMDSPILQDVVQEQIEKLQKAMRPIGLGMSSAFITDGDNTSVAVIVLLSSNKEVKINALKRFQKEDYFYTYPHELQLSLTTTSHGTYALHLLGENVFKQQEFLVNQQQANGRWLGDKWHSSWLYTTLQIVPALTSASPNGALKRVIRDLLAHQRVDGGWGLNSHSTSTQTAYAILTLHTLHTHNLLKKNEEILALKRGQQWLIENYRPFTFSNEAYWTGKELYCPPRVDRAFELSSMLLLNPNNVTKKI